MFVGRTGRCGVPPLGEGPRHHREDPARLRGLAGRKIATPAGRSACRSLPVANSSDASKKKAGRVAVRPPGREIEQSMPEGPACDCSGEETVGSKASGDDSARSQARVEHRLHQFNASRVFH